MGTPEDPFEDQAEAVAESVAEGRPAVDLLAPLGAGAPPGLSAMKQAAGSRKPRRRKRKIEQAPRGRLSDAGAKGDGTAGQSEQDPKRLRTEAEEEARPPEPEALEKLNLARVRLDDFALYLSTISAKHIDAIAEVNRKFARKLRIARREGTRIVKDATQEYDELQRHLKESSASASAAASPGRRYPTAERKSNVEISAEFDRPVVATITKYEKGMQDIEILFASPPPTKKFKGVHGDKTEKNLYHTGEREDPIPFVWYKSPESYKEVTTDSEEDSETYKFPDGPQLPQPATGQLSAKPVNVGAVLLNLGSQHEARGKTVAYVRKSLTNLGVGLKGLDIDHVLDLGFAGADQTDNMWPLDEDVNRRPVRGWRTSYGLNYLEGDGRDAKLATKAINDLIGKHFVVKAYMDDSEENVPEEGQKPSPQAGVSKKDEAKVK